MSSRKFVAFRFRHIKVPPLYIQDKASAVEQGVAIRTAEIHIWYRKKNTTVVFLHTEGGVRESLVPNLKIHLNLLLLFFKSLLATIVRHGVPISEWVFLCQHCWGVCEQNNIVSSVDVDDSTAEWAIIANNQLWRIWVPCYRSMYAKMCRI